MVEFDIMEVDTIEKDRLLMKKLTIISSVILSSLLILTGCGSNSSKKSNVTSKVKVVKQSSSKKSQKGVAKKKSGSLWNNDKDSHLEDFMKQWGEVMNQTYTKYDGTNNIQTASGMNYPQDFNSATVNGQNVSMAWDKKGTGKNDYNVVAIYNYNKSSSSSITYAFTLADGEPIVLVNEGSGNNWNATKNKSLRENFVNIFDGKATHVEKPKVSSSSSEKSSSSTKATEDLGEGRGGYVTTPEAMRGTWYSKGEDGMKKLVISEHEITLISADGETNHTILYKRTKDTPSDVSESERQSKEEWRSAGNIGTNGISMRGWYQLQGGGEHFFTHEEEIDGQKVPLVLYGFGANDLTDYVYYPSEDLANKQSDAKYDDINYKF